MMQEKYKYKVVEIETNDLIEIGQKSLESAFGQDGYKVRHSKIVCDYHRCTSGNWLLCTDDIVRRFRRFIDVKRKVVYWSFL